MRRSLALLIPAALLAAACTQSPTAATRTPSIRFDGGNVTGSDGGGILMGGGGYTPAPGTAAVSANTPSIGTGGGTLLDVETNTAVVDSASRGGNYFGSGN